MKVYIDESGNLGLKDRYFVITALIPHNERSEKSIKNLIKRYHVKLCIPKGYDEIKASKLSFPEKQNLLNTLTKSREYTVNYIVVDKYHIAKKLFKEKNVCYNYIASHLIQRILENCQEDIHIIIDNHSTKVTSANSLCDYIKARAFGDWGFEYNIRIDFSDSKLVKGLQAVDLLSNPIYAKYNYGTDHLFNINSKNYVHKIKFPHIRFGL